MPKFRPSAVASADYDVSLSPTLTGDLQVKLSREPFYELGEVVITGANAATFTPRPSALARLDSVPSSLVLAVTGNPVFSSADIQLALAGTDQASAADSFAGTFSMPVWLDDTERLFRPGWAVDLVGSPASDLVKTLTGAVTATCNADAAGARFKVFRLPPLTGFKLVPCLTSVGYTPAVRQPVAIACGYKRNAWVKQGQENESALELAAKQGVPFKGLQKYSGGVVTAMLELVQAERFVVSRQFFSNVVITDKFASGGEGSGENTASMTSQFEEMVLLAAE